jgi:hypothetical protein
MGLLLLSRGVELLKPAVTAVCLMATAAVDWRNAPNIYGFGAKDIDGNQVTLDKYKGNVVIILNGACK